MPGWKVHRIIAQRRPLKSFCVYIRGDWFWHDRHTWISVFGESYPNGFNTTGFPEFSTWLAHIVTGRSYSFPRNI
jgi:hypothetical protein